MLFISRIEGEIGEGEIRQHFMAIKKKNAI